MTCARGTKLDSDVNGLAHGPSFLSSRAGLLGPRPEIRFGCLDILFDTFVVLIDRSTVFKYEKIE